MQDYIVRALVSGTVSVYAGVTTQTVEEARKIHHMNPTPCVALGRTLTGAALMSRTLKGSEDTITIQIKGDGPIGGIVAVTDAHANVRGYVHNPFFDLPLNEKGKFDIAGAVGRGYLNVVKDIGLKEPYIGHVDLVSGEIAEDLTYYYASSEQIPTAMNLGVLVGSGGHVLAAGGFLVQLMPDTPEDMVSFLEERIGRLPPITNMIADGLTPEKIIDSLFHGKPIQTLETCGVSYRCTCSRERMERNLLAIGRKDLLEIARDKKGAELHCHFCNTRYTFTPEEFEELIRDMK
ncbi:MAG TPA: Hsp33 family molecular chaperone HslO [Thermoclostridium sp.]|nr:Hsp33 family molecular chaperone HslO [Clostridiaceae bacterium]HOQ74945.1 Hsp33 family molecular chaperone HslO [Thermoclostridium sp.]HPU45506.1 Hsp33 family molecular chaperone HslO [Thermoclostridium sp.]